MNNQTIRIAIYFILTIVLFIAFRIKQNQNMKLSQEEQTQMVSRAFKRVIRNALFGGIAFFTFSSIVTGIFYFNQKNIDGDFAYKGESVNLNEAIKSGNLPENGTYVTVKFNLVGEEYFPDDNSVIYHPIILIDSGDKPCVIAISESTNSDFLDKSGYVQSSNSFISEGADRGDKIELEFTGRLSDINSTYDKYTSSLETSNISYSNYTVKNIFVNASKSRDELKSQLDKLFLLFIVFTVLDILMIICTIIVLNIL